ncbi:hypothetical protein [Hymenobacter sp. GOD-10R]|uniref:hypothetical protein n=1 Tax=Hymenobacter sp. GOD-10R TaxID=3093922 RepID=UPI002D76C6E4|nr:hypothetical protein [Hymenobacter sp. GOD-10R]WRQ27642.1 hypothetical protein SD425_21460 [Hymenobacter sp. GOD-10R]
MLQQDLLVDTPSFVLFYDRASQCIYAEWKGPHDATSVVAGCSAMRQSLAKQPCAKILDDSRQITNNWDEVAEWVGTDFFRILSKQGVRYFARICPTDPASRQSVKRTFQYAKHMEVALFDDVASAYAWLQDQP